MVVREHLEESLGSQVVGAEKKEAVMEFVVVELRKMEVVKGIQGVLEHLVAALEHPEFLAFVVDLEFVAFQVVDEPSAAFRVFQELVVSQGFLELEVVLVLEVVEGAYLVLMEEAAREFLAFQELLGVVLVAAVVGEFRVLMADLEYLVENLEFLAVVGEMEVGQVFEVVDLEYVAVVEYLVDYPEAGFLESEVDQEFQAVEVVLGYLGLVMDQGFLVFLEHLVDVLEFQEMEAVSEHLECLGVVEIPEVGLALLELPVLVVLGAVEEEAE